jgi:hypothetical protein
MTAPSVREESDFLGTHRIPAAAYWGVHAARAVENFPVSGQPLSCMPELVRALAFVKKASTRANAALGALDAQRAEAAHALGVMAPDEMQALLVPQRLTEPILPRRCVDPGMSAARPLRRRSLPLEGTGRRPKGAS